MTRAGKRLWWGALVLLLVGVALAVGWFLRGADRAVLPVDVSTGVQATRPELEGQGLSLTLPKPQRPTAIMFAQTPELPSEASAVEAMALLGDLARRGDPIAQCELGVILNECRQQRSVIGRLASSTVPVGMDSSAVDRYVEVEARRQEWMDRLAARCEGLSNADLARGVVYQARAAVSGQIDSLISFMSAPQLASAEFLRDPTLSMIYRTQLWPILHEGLKSGNGRLVDAFLIQVMRGENASLAAVVPVEFSDPAMAMALRQRLYTRNQPGVGGLPLHQEWVPTVDQAEADRWVRELFGGELSGQRADIMPAGASGPRDGRGQCREPQMWLGGG